MAINRPDNHTTVQPQAPKAARTGDHHEACLWQRGMRRVNSLPPGRTTPIIRQTPDQSPSRQNLRRSLSSFRLTPVKSGIPQGLQQGRINGFSLALQQGDLKQLISIISKTYHLTTLQVMAEKLTDATILTNIEEPLLAPTWHQLHKAMAEALFFQLGGYTVDGLNEDFLSKAHNDLGALPDDICNGTLECLKTKQIIGTLGIHVKRPETKQFIETLADNDFDQAEALINKCHGNKILEYMGQKALRLSKHPSTQEAGFTGAEIVQNRLKELKAEDLFRQYGGHDPEGPDPDFMAKATAGELYKYPLHFIRAVKQRLETRLNPEQIAEKLLARQVGTAAADQLFSGDDNPDSPETDSPGKTILDRLDTEKVLDSCSIDLIDYTEAFREEVLAILDFILMPEDAPDRLPPAPPLPDLPPSTNRKKG
ncbi:hypothetical protein [Endozoicomonas sp.]|uniref:hypothetical protein n=1 Tax=Endozoicomonas sp. TaxID=1892382 RepID=UPI002887E4B7|nr:hypothetical protein [Endozoicomonas sp.]